MNNIMEAPLVFLLMFLLAGFAAPLLARANRRRKQQQAIPRSELATLGTAIKNADELASGGRVGDGLACLVAGLRQAEQARHRRAPWAEDLAERWQSVVDEYATEHRIGPTTEIVPASPPEGRGDEPAAM
jgi:hypothetical protein